MQEVHVGERLANLVSRGGQAVTPGIHEVVTSARGLKPRFLLLSSRSPK